MPATIIQTNDPRLRQVSRVLTEKEFNTTAFSDLLNEMRATLAACPDGIALAAPQIGINQRLFIVSPKAFDAPKNKTTENYLIFANPAIKRQSRQKSELEEGCLSVRSVYGLIKRSTRVTISAQDEHGNRFERSASGLLAQIFQHEIDHLDGKLFIDQARALRTITND
ncbi:MAG: peptide deformylase [Patescibacteria group bacterium]